MDTDRIDTDRIDTDSLNINDKIQMILRQTDYTEEQAKEKLQEYRIKKSEWFKCDSDVIESLKQNIISSLGADY